MRNAPVRPELRSPPAHEIAWSVTSLGGSEIREPCSDGVAALILARTWFEARDEAIRRLAEKGYYYDRDTVGVQPWISGP